MGERSTALKNRNRVVVFRVTQEEYKHLRNVCLERGGRNLSEFTRSELLAFLKSAGQSDERMAVLERKLASLQYSVQHIIRLMESAGSRVDSNNGY
jgi:hypothetical protein